MGHIQTMIGRIQDVLASLPALSTPGPWALLDFPTHSNVGDSAIWAGSVALLTPVFGRPPAYVTRNLDYPHGLMRACPEGPILLLGGGNFGDVWPGIQELRVQILRDFSHRPIVQLPQSIHFSSPEAADATRRAVADHSSFTLLVRDRNSLDFARRQFDCPVILCPDMAYGLRELSSDVLPSSPVLSLLRSDHESRQSHENMQVMEDLGPVTDWVHARWRLSRPARWILSARRKGPVFSAALAPAVERVFHAKALQEVRRGVDVLSQGRIVVTDRLHAHILCVLLNKPHVVMDNSYGKVHGYIRTWPDDGLTYQVSTLSAAREAAKELLSSGGPGPAGVFS